MALRAAPRPFPLFLPAVIDLIASTKKKNGTRTLRVVLAHLASAFLSVRTHVRLYRHTGMYAYKCADVLNRDNENRK